MLFPAPVSKFFPKKIAYIFSKKIFLTFREMELLSLNIRKNIILFGLIPQIFSLTHFLYFFPKKFLIFSQKKPFLIFRKRNFLIFWEKYIQNPEMFRTRSIFRTLVYSKSEAYSEHCQTSTMERFVKVAT